MLMKLPYRKSIAFSLSATPCLLVLPKKQQNKIDNLRYLITDILCCNYATPDYNNIIILENNDIKVTEGERDSFGWLTAVLHLKKGKILLG